MLISMLLTFVTKTLTGSRDQTSETGLGDGSGARRTRNGTRLQSE
jgi:hypothetical protein